VNTPDLLVKAAKLLKEWKEDFDAGQVGLAPALDTETWLEEYAKKEGNTSKTGLT
jgi:predicted transcriptional regulator